MTTLLYNAILRPELFYYSWHVCACFLITLRWNRQLSIWELMTLGSTESGGKRTFLWQQVWSLVFALSYRFLRPCVQPGGLSCRIQYYICIRGGLTFNSTKICIYSSWTDDITGYSSSPHKMSTNFGLLNSISVHSNLHFYCTLHCVSFGLELQRLTNEKKICC